MHWSLWGIFEKLQTLVRDVFKTSRIWSRRLKGVTQKTSFFRCIWDVLKMSQKSPLFWDVSERSRNIARIYENILLVWDLIIDILDKKKDSKNYLSDSCDTFSLSDLISEVTCVKSSVGSSIDLMLTNRPRSFHHISLIETSLSDYHKLTL